MKLTSLFLLFCIKAEKIIIRFCYKGKPLDCIEDFVYHTSGTDDIDLDIKIHCSNSSSPAFIRHKIKLELNNSEISDVVERQRRRYRKQILIKAELNDGVMIRIADCFFNIICKLNGCHKTSPLYFMYIKENRRTHPSKLKTYEERTAFYQYQSKKYEGFARYGYMYDEIAKMSAGKKSVGRFTSCAHSIRVLDLFIKCVGENKQEKCSIL